MPTILTNFDKTFAYTPLTVHFRKNEAMLSQELTGDLNKRLKFIKGQIEGIIRMVEAGKDPDQISNLFKATDQALQKVHFLLLDEVFRKSFALNLVQVMNSCPGNCPDAQKIELL